MVDRQEFHLKLGHIAQLLGVLDDCDKAYFDIVQLEYIMAEFVKKEELDGTMVTAGATLINSMRT